MAIKTYRPNTPGLRGMTSQDFSMLTTNKPVKSLIKKVKRSNGRNNQGRITTRHKGGGIFQFYRIVSFGLPVGTKATVEHIEYDPNRTARIARLREDNGTMRYILAPANLKIGAELAVGADVPIEIGNRLPLSKIPTGTQIHCIELKPGRGGQMVRSAGGSAQLLAKDELYVQIKLGSGEVRRVLATCHASIGVIGNEQHQNIKWGKAGRRRKMGIRPSVRGVVMNAVDHPHGGGDGGRHRMARAPVSPWGTKTLGFKTRRRKSTDKFIVKSRHESKR
jgi:large subunit ribosomal protein L2